MLNAEKKNTTITTQDFCTFRKITSHRHDIST